MKTLIPENNDFFSKYDTCSIGTQATKKVQEKKEHNIKMLPKEQVYSDRKHYHLNYDKHAMSHPCTCLESRKKDNISKSGIERTEWKTMTLFVFGIGIWNLRNPKIQKAHYI